MRWQTSKIFNFEYNLNRTIHKKCIWHIIIHFSTKILLNELDLWWISVCKSKMLIVKRWKIKCWFKIAKQKHWKVIFKANNWVHFDWWEIFSKSYLRQGDRFSRAADPSLGNPALEGSEKLPKKLYINSVPFSLN